MLVETCLRKKVLVKTERKIFEFFSGLLGSFVGEVKRSMGKSVSLILLETRELK